MRAIRLRLPYRGLFLELALAISAVVAIAFAFNAWISITAGRGQLVELVENDLELRARTVLQQIERHLDRCADELSYWARLETFDDVLIEDRGMRVENLLISLQRENEELFEELSVIDRAETVIASTDFITIGENRPLASLGLLPESRGGLLMNDFPNFRDPPKRPLLMVQPIVSRLDPEPIGWILAQVSWRPIENFVSAPPALDEVGRSFSQFLVLLDDHGHLLAMTDGLFEQSPDVETLVARIRTEEVPPERSGEFGPYLVSTQGSQATVGTAASRLQILALWKTSEAYSVVRSFMLAVVGSAILGLVLAGGASFGIARMITGRIRTLTQGTKRLAEGDLDHRVEEGRDDEIGRLARSFNTMAEGLAGARDDLQAAAARWQALVANAPDTVMTVSLDGTITFINRTVEGLTQDEVVGSTIYDYMPERFHDAARTALADARRFREARSFEMEARGKDDSLVRYSVRVGPIEHEQGVVAFTIIATDVTDERRMERDILEVSEQERERIGQDLHDDLGQILTGISLLAKGLQQKLARSAPTEADEVGQIDEHIKNAISQTRALARGLLPIGLEKHGLEGALEELTNNVDSIYGIQCSFEGVAVDLERADARHVFRIAQEAVNNALKHGEATQIDVRLIDNGENRILIIEDNGVGISNDVDAGVGMGLRLMKYRASKIGGSLDVRPRPDRGTVVHCRF